MDRASSSVAAVSTGDGAVDELQADNFVIATGSSVTPLPGVEVDNAAKRIVGNIRQVHPKLKMIITADAQAHHQYVVRAMDAAGQMGFVHLSITDPIPVDHHPKSAVRSLAACPKIEQQRTKIRRCGGRWRARRNPVGLRGKGLLFFMRCSSSEVIDGLRLLRCSDAEHLRGPARHLT